MTEASLASNSSGSKALDRVLMRISELDLDTHLLELETHGFTTISGVASFRVRNAIRVWSRKKFWLDMQTMSDSASWCINSSLTAGRLTVLTLS